MPKKNNHFTNEIIPIPIKIKKEVNFADDEFPRHGSTIEKISSLKPVFKRWNCDCRKCIWFK